MKDRLAELKNLQSDAPPEYEESVFDTNTSAKSPFLDDFFTQIEEIQQNIIGIKDNVLEVKKKHSDILTAPQQSDRTKEELEQLMGSIKRSSNKVQNSLKSMQRHIEEQESTSEGKYAEVRIKKSQHSSLQREFVEVMHDYNAVQNDYRDRCKNRIQRQLEITGRSTTSEELEEMIESGNPAIFTQGIIVDTQQAKQSLRDIEARHNDIMKLENSIRELHEMFSDLAILVESQGEMIDRIEHNVESAAEYVQEAASDINKAVVYQSKARRINAMDEKCPKRKAKSGSTSEHKQEKRKRFSSSDFSEDSSATPDSDGGEVDKKDRGQLVSSKTDGKRSRKESKRKKKEKKHKHKKERLKKKKKHKSKSHMHKARAVKDDDEGATTKDLDPQPIGKPIVKRVMVPMTKEEYEKQQSIMKHVLDPDTGRYRLIKGDGEVMEEIVSHSRHKEINKLATRGDGATFQRKLGLGK